MTNIKHRVQISHTPDPCGASGLVPAFRELLVGESGTYSPFQESLCQHSTGTGAMEPSSGEPSNRPDKMGGHWETHGKLLEEHLHRCLWALGEGREKYQMSPKQAAEPSARGEREWHGVFKKAKEAESLECGEW